jgi:hypothetical protein
MTLSCIAIMKPVVFPYSSPCFNHKFDDCIHVVVLADIDVPHEVLFASRFEYNRLLWGCLTYVSYKTV